MCIRDSNCLRDEYPFNDGQVALGADTALLVSREGAQPSGCLLYTSDAADERSSVDLGGRRIIKKKNERTDCEGSAYHTTIRHKEQQKQR